MLRIFARSVPSSLLAFSFQGSTRRSQRVEPVKQQPRRVPPAFAFLAFLAKAHKVLLECVPVIYSSQP